MKFEFSTHSLTWPLSCFEADGFPVVVPDAGGLDDLYEDDYWDEIELCVDGDGTIVLLEMQNGVLVFHTTGRAFPHRMELMRASLSRFYHPTFLRFKAASLHETLEILSLSPTELRRAFYAKFSAKNR